MALTSNPADGDSVLDASIHAESKVYGLECPPKFEIRFKTRSAVSAAR